MAYLFHVINICGSLIEEYPGVQVRKTQVCFLRQNVRLLYTTHLFIPNAMKLNAQPNAPLFLQIIYWVILGLFKEAFQCYTIVSWNGNFTSEWFEIGVMGNREYPLVFFFKIFPNMPVYLRRSWIEVWNISVSIFGFMTHILDATSYLHYLRWRNL